MPNDPTTTEAELQRLNQQLAAFRTELHHRRRAPDTLSMAFAVCLGLWFFIASIVLPVVLVSAITGWSIYQTAANENKQHLKEIESRKTPQPSPTPSR